jgi:enoyl-CoA hydratase
MEYKNILFEVENNVAVITFNRPKVLNVINLETMLELNNIIHNS